MKRPIPGVMNIMRRDDNATDMHWNRHVGLTYTEPETGEDGIDFGAVASDGREYRFPPGNECTEGAERRGIL